MGVKVKDFINKKYEGKDVSNSTTIEEIDFYNYMINKMEELGVYVGIDTTSFSDDFFIRDDSNDFSMLYKTIIPKTLYCYNKNNSFFNLVLYSAVPREDIFLIKAVTCKINLEDFTFEYHEFIRPQYLKYEINIIHKKMSGVIPYYLFDQHDTYSIIKHVINADFDSSSLSDNFIDELKKAIESGKNIKEYIYDDTLMWEMNYSMDDLYSRLESNCMELYTVIKDLPLEDAKKVLIEHSSEVRNVNTAVELLELIDYKNKYNKRSNNGFLRTHK